MVGGEDVGGGVGGDGDREAGELDDCDVVEPGGAFLEFLLVEGEFAEVGGFVGVVGAGELLGLEESHLEDEGAGGGRGAGAGDVEVEEVPVVRVISDISSISDIRFWGGIGLGVEVEGGGGDEVVFVVGEVGGELGAGVEEGGGFDVGEDVVVGGGVDGEFSWGVAEGGGASVDFEFEGGVAFGGGGLAWKGVWSNWPEEKAGKPWPWTWDQNMGVVSKLPRGFSSKSMVLRMREPGGVGKASSAAGAVMGDWARARRGSSDAMTNDK